MLNNIFELARPQSIGMVTQGPLAHLAANFPGACHGRVSQTINNLFPTIRYKYLLERFKELFDTSPTVGDQARSGAGGFKNSGWRRKTYARHGIPIDVEHHARGAGHAVVIASTHMTNPTY